MQLPLFPNVLFFRFYVARTWILLCGMQARSRSFSGSRLFGWLLCASVRLCHLYCPSHDLPILRIGEEDRHGQHGQKEPDQDMRCNDVGVRGLVPPAHAMVHHKVDDVQHGQINPIEIDVSLFRSRPRLLQAVCLRRWLRAYLGGS